MPGSPDREGRSGGDSEGRMPGTGSAPSQDPVGFVDTTLRDGVQSLWASWIGPELFREVAPAIDRAEFRAMEVPLNPIFFRKMLRDLKINPWDVCRLVGQMVRRTPRACMVGTLLRGFEYRAPKSLLRLYLQKIAETKALTRAQMTPNRMDEAEIDFPYMVPLLRELGYQVVVAIAYDDTPRHTVGYYVEQVHRALQFSVDAIYLKDFGGILTPERAREILPAMKNACGSVPFELHSHCTIGLADMTYVEAVRSGVRVLHTGIPPLASGTAQPSIFRTLRNLQALGAHGSLDLVEVEAASKTLRGIAQARGLPEGRPSEFDLGYFEHRVPGGVLSNLRHQLRELGLEDRLEEVLQEVVRVRRELGDPMMITPYAQMVVTQAAFNIATGRRYEVVPDDVIRFALGWFGRESGADQMDPDVRDHILGRQRAKEIEQTLQREAEEREKGVEEIKREMGYTFRDDEEFLNAVIYEGYGRTEGAGPPGELRELERSEVRPRERRVYVEVRRGDARALIVLYPGPRVDTAP
jgi:oxaloacetate decarboxylase alpha subunit